MTFSTKIATAAAEIRPARAALTVLALPFYVLGYLLGAVLVAVLWIAGAVKVGITDARAKLGPPAPPPAADSEAT